MFGVLPMSLVVYQYVKAIVDVMSSKCGGTDSGAWRGD